MDTTQLWVLALFVPGCAVLMIAPFILSAVAGHNRERNEAAEKAAQEREFAEIRARGLWYPIECVVDGKHYNSDEEGVILIAIDWQQGYRELIQRVLLRLPSGQFAEQQHHSRDKSADTVRLLDPEEAAEFFWDADEQVCDYQQVFGDLIEEA